MRPKILALGAILFAQVLLVNVSAASDFCPDAAIPVSHRAEKFIWASSETAPYHFFMFARRNFEFENVPKSALLHITASDRYMLFVNGDAEFVSNFAEEKGFRAAVVTLDFGRQVFGFPRIKMKSDAGVIVDIARATAVTVCTAFLWFTVI